MPTETIETVMSLQRPRRVPVQLQHLHTRYVKPRQHKQLSVYLCPEGDEEETPNSKRESKSTCESVSDITPKPSASKSRNQLKRIHKEQHHFLLVAAEWLETV